jgi:hypothetical protein
VLDFSAAQVLLRSTTDWYRAMWMEACFDRICVPDGVVCRSFLFILGERVMAVVKLMARGTLRQSQRSC